MKHGARNAIDRALLFTPAQPWFRKRTARHPVILGYHGVGDAAAFEEQMRFLTERMRPVSLNLYLGALAVRAPLPERSVLVTFDDGDPSVLEVGLPILRRQGVPAVVFVVPGLIGTSAPFWWNEVEELMARGARAASLGCGSAEACIRLMKTLPDERRRSVMDELRASAGGPPVEARQLTAEELRTLEAGGVAIGNHTMTHPCLDRCEKERAEAEVVRAHERLTELLGAPPRAFAFPNGNFDPRVAPVLRRLGCEAAFLFDHAVSTHPPGDPMRISRVRVNAGDTLARFRIAVSGLHPALHHALGRA